MKINSHIFANSLALIAGALLTLAFAPFAIFPLAIISPALLLAVWLHVSPRQAFLRGFLFGIGFFATGVYWIFISIHTFGNSPAWLAALITALLIAVLALFPAITGYLLNRFFIHLNNTKILCAFPALWVFLEWVRSWIFSGFPWLLLGSSQITSPLRGYAPLFSVYAVSLAVVFSSGLLVNIVLKISQKKYKAVGVNLFAFIILWIIGGSLCLIHWTQPAGEPIKVSLVQGNIAQEMKWTPEQIEPTLALYKKLTEEHWDSNIIIWPEAAVTPPAHLVEDYLADVSNAAKQHHASVITGIPIKLEQGYYNAVVTLGEGKGIYFKRRLVPFGEYVPLPGLLRGFLDRFKIPMSDFLAGPKLPAFEINHTKIAVFICYEIAFPEQVLSRDGNIGLLLTVSNDAWFGRSIAQAQHLEMAEMRALEMGRPVLFVSNDGITAFINATGKIQSAAPAHQLYVLTDNVQPMQGKTPWQRFAMDPILIILSLMLIIAIRQEKVHVKKI